MNQLAIIENLFEITNSVIEKMESKSLKTLDDFIKEVSDLAGMSLEEASPFIKWFLSKSEDVELPTLSVINTLPVATKLVQNKPCLKQKQKQKRDKEMRLLLEAKKAKTVNRNYDEYY